MLTPFLPSLQAKQTQFPQLSLWEVHPNSPANLATLPQTVTTSLVPWGPRWNIFLQMKPHSCQVKGIVTSLDLLPLLLLMQVSTLLAFITSRALCNLTSTSTSGTIFCGAVAYLSNINAKQLEISSGINIRTTKIPTQDHTANQVAHSFNQILH